MNLQKNNREVTAEIKAIKHKPVKKQDYENKRINLRRTLQRQRRQQQQRI